LRKYKFEDKKIEDIDYISEMMDNVYTSYTKGFEAAIKNIESVPKNATIIPEWIKCGKQSCRKCSKNEYYHKYYGEHYPHGPYYYAYWRDTNNEGRLKKKYIGEHNPRDSYAKEVLNDLRKNDKFTSATEKSTD